MKLRLAKKVYKNKRFWTSDFEYRGSTELRSRKRLPKKWRIRDIVREVCGEVAMYGLEPQEKLAS